EKTKVKFSKKALTANGEELKGATIKLTKENGTVIKEWVTDGKLTEFELEDGSYTFTEISAPDKYQVATAITFEVKAGKVLVTGTEVKGNTIVMVDKLKKTPITHLSTPTTQNIEKMRALNTSINNTLPKTGAGASLSPYGIFMGLLGTLLITIELRKRRKEN
ncbi:SpaA isopeptide-forming pilin-related protein, partial [Peptostreptococcus sp. D1]|uniref:SpaA isopeptide-forming pilin-related protein n=1 Tax=Peptostreptococcus sp. D1 TaxID=72304 RepID=UPI0008DFAC18